MFDFIVQFISGSGYFGLFALMALENIFPPIPSEMIMALAGFIAARGDFHIAALLAAGTAGSVVGTLPWYYAGRHYGKEGLRKLANRHGRWLTIAPHDIDEALNAFEKHGRRAVFFGRLVPAIRTLISVPAGIVHMPLMQYLLYSTIGSLIWIGLLAAAGFVLEFQFELVEKYLNPVSNVIVGSLVAWYLYRVVSYRAEKPD